MKDRSRHARSNAPGMPVIYRFGRRRDAIFLIGFLAVVSSLMFMPMVVLLFRVIPVIGKRPAAAEDFAAALGVAAFGLLGIWVVWSAIKQSTYEVRLRGDRVEFLWLLGTIRVPLSSVRAIARGTLAVHEEDGDPRAIRLRHARGTITISYFPEIDDLIRELTRANPLLEVTGEWRA